MKISVVMSVYMRDDSIHLAMAIESLIKQTFIPDEIIIVGDGLLTADLYKVIKKYQDNHKIIKFISYEENKGPAFAWDLGIKESNNEWIARMDADDICEESRFETQLSYISDHPDLEIIGGYIKEFENDPNEVVGERKVPISPKKIYSFAKFRCPFNHVTVIFKKTSYEKAGGYKQITGFVDYYLWARMLNNNVSVSNIPEYLVRVRVGNDMIGRRSGYQYAKNECLLFIKMYKMRFINTLQLIRNIMIRLPLRILPKNIINQIYKFR